MAINHNQLLEESCVNMCQPNCHPFFCLKPLTQEATSPAADGSFIQKVMHFGYKAEKLRFHQQTLGLDQQTYGRFKGCAEITMGLSKYWVSCQTYFKILRKIRKS
jgi:hypothetical protein